MKYTFLISILFPILFSCSTDTESIIGEWKFSRVSKGKEVFVSNNLKEVKAIIDAAVRSKKQEFAQLNLSEKMYRTYMKRDIDLMLKVTFTFQENDTVVISSNSTDNPSEPTKWKYTMDEQKHLLTIQETDRTIPYTYQLKDKKLILKDGNDQVEFERLK